MFVSKYKVIYFLVKWQEIPFFIVNFANSLRIKLA